MKFDISKGQILALSSNADVYRRGEICFMENGVANVDIAFDSGKCSYLITAQAQGDYMKPRMKVSVTSEGVIKSYSCECNANTIWRGACKHVIALLFYISASQFQSYEYTMRAQTAGKLIKALERHSFFEADKELGQAFNMLSINKGELKLESELYVNSDDSVMLRLYIGKDRLYVVKNIRELIISIKNETTTNYGKNLTVKHSVSAFDTQSQKIIEICEKKYNSLLSIQDRYNRFNWNSIFERDMPLSPSELDDIIDIYAGRYIAVSSPEGERGKMLVTDDAPRLKFDIKDSRDGLTVSVNDTSYDCAVGIRYGYLIGYGFIHRVPEGCVKVISTFMNSFKELNRSSIMFNTDDRHRFYSFVFPQLKKYNLISDVLSLAPESGFLPDKKLYFDCDGKRVTCRPELVYGEKSYNPLQDTENRPENRVEEFKVAKMLGMLGFSPDKDKGLYTLSKDDNIYELYNGGLDTVSKVAEVFVTDAFTNQKMAAGIKTKVGVRISGNLLHMSVEMGEYSLADLIDAVSSYNVKKKYHRLKDGRFMNLEDEDISAAAEFISSFDVSKKDIRKDTLMLPKFRAMYLEKLIEENKKISIEADAEFKRLTDDFNGAREAEYETPAELENVLRPYQKIGYKWLKTLSGYEFGGILADDMGLGKTIQVITLLLSEPDKSLPSLVVAPTSLMYNWEHEFKKFAPDMKPVVLSGVPARRQELLENSQEADVFITTYDMLKRDIDTYEKKSFRYVIADEAQYIKNPGTQNATSIKRIKSVARFALTGTPIENSLSELWSIFDFILPGYLYNASKFSKLYETPIIKNDDKERAGQLQRQISPFILRRLKKDVLTELPDKVETTLYADMYPEQRKIYLANLMIAKGAFDDAVESGEFAKSKLQILAQITRLRQVSCHPSLFVEDYDGGSGKLDLAVETIQSAAESEHRMLLFSQFTSMLSILRVKLDELGIEYFYLDGSTPPAARQEMAGRFNAGERRVFLISLRAGGTGLNLTGADIVIHYDQWWNPAVMSQATDRAHRIGQEKIVQVINIVSKDSIEEKILELQAKKKDLVDSVLKEGESFISRMSIEEVRALFAE